MTVAKVESAADIQHGIGVITAAVFISGEMIGSGILALPRAVVDAGWSGFLLVIIFGISSCYCGVKLGQCWEIIEERYPKYKKMSRNPYTDIGEQAMGTFGRLTVTICNYFALFGVSTVYILLASQMLHALLEDYFPDITFCVWIIILALILTPPMWLGSPKDIWMVGVFALSTTIISCVLIFIQMIRDYKVKKIPVIHKEHSFMDIFTSCGTILFSFGGAAIFPAIQNDMKNRGKFKISVILAFGVIIGLYLPMAFLGYVVYGEDSKENIIFSLSNSKLVTFSNLLMALHTIMAFLICTNPLSLQTENLFNVPNEFSIKRCTVRTGLVFLIIIVGETVPEFGKILAVVGASTTTLTTFVFPNIFYIRLCNQQYNNTTKRTISWRLKLFLWILILVGIGGGIAATYSSILSIFTSKTLLKPCYWPK